jgi:hypothetical protein
MCQPFEFAGWEIFLAELDVIDICRSGFGDLREERAPLRGGIAGKLRAIGDVVEDQPGTILAEKKKQQPGRFAWLSLSLLCSRVSSGFWRRLRAAIKPCGTGVRYLLPMPGALCPFGYSMSPHGEGIVILLTGSCNLLW